MPHYRLSRPFPLLLLAAALAALSCAGSPRVSDDSEPGGGEDLRLRKAQILRAEDRRVVDEALLAAVEHPRTRAFAIRALGRIGDVVGLPYIEAALEDGDASVRAEAVFALGLRGDPASIPRLLGLLDDPEARVRGLLGAALGLIEGPAAAEGLHRLLSDPVPAVVTAACYALAGHSEAGVAVEALIRLSADERAEVASAAVHALGRLAAPTDRLDFASRRRARSRLVELASSPSVETRRIVAHGLAIPGGTGEADALIALTNDADPLVRVNAVRSFSFPGSPIGPDLRRTLNDSDDRVVLATLQGLTRMRGQDVVDTLVELIVGDDRIWLRERAVGALRAVDPDQAVGLADGLSRSDRARIRLAAAGLLLGRRDEQALEYAERLLADSDPRVRRAAIPAMAGAAGPLGEVLGEWAEATDPADRAALAQAAGWRLADGSRSAEEREEAIHLLERLWRESEVELDVDLLGEVLDAAVRGGPEPRTRELLETALGCSDRRIRLRAIEHLRMLYGEDRSDAAGPASELPLEHYLKVTRWARLPRAAIVTVERPGFVPGRFTVKLNTRDAPLTCWNFVQLAEQGYYRGLRIRGVIPDVRVDFGERSSDGPARPSHAIRDELMPHWFGPGTLVMGHAQRDSAEAEWFVTLATQPQLVGRRTPFGRVVQNFPGVTALLLPDDVLVSVTPYEGDGSEPLPRLGGPAPGAIDQSD